MTPQASKFISDNKNLTIEFHKSDSSAFVVKNITDAIASKLCSRYKASGIFSGNSKDFIICNIGQY